MQTQKITCDISDRKNHSDDAENFLIEVIFDHDQEDGKSKTKPYLDGVKIDICKSCLRYMLETRSYIYAYGAMGYNKYYLMGNKKMYRNQIKNLINELKLRLKDNTEIIKYLNNWERTYFPEQEGGSNSSQS